MTAYAEAILLSIAPFLFFRSPSESRGASMSNSTWTVALPGQVDLGDSAPGFPVATHSPLTSGYSPPINVA